MPESLPDRAVVAQEAAAVSRTTAVADPRVTAAGEAALAQAQALARRAAAPATLRAYKADWTHYAARSRRVRAPPCGRAVPESGALSAHALRVGFITEAYGKGVRDEDIM